MQESANTPLAPILAVEKLSNDDVSEIVDMESEATETGWARNEISESTQNGHYCYKLMADKEICGYCIVRQVGEELELLNLVISKKSQGKGFGGYLLEQIVGFDEFSNILDIWLEVRSSNRAAQVLYKKLGFSVVGKRRGYYSKSGKSEDALIMQCPTKLSGSGRTTYNQLLSGM